MDVELELANREQGQVPVSIGTSLAIEGAAGILEDNLVNPAPLLSYRELWVNVRTLFRNLYNCLSTEVRNRVLPQHIVPILKDEMDMLEAAVQQITGGRTKLVFYYCSYKSLFREYPKALHRQYKTELQQFFRSLEQVSLDELMKTFDESITFHQFDIRITGRHPSSLMLTHMPTDLLSYQSFDNLVLLESHTGKLKRRREWNTKLTGGKDLERIPFNRMTLQMFGDGGVLFSPMPIKIRRTILEIAEKRRWTAVTSKDKILSDVKHYRDPHLDALVRSLF